MKRPVTIKDIARNLGISPSTVSRALKDNPEISVDTKKKVWKLAKELDYEPNSLALNLLQNKTNTIGVVLPELVHFFFSTVISGIEEVAYAKGYNVIICQSNESLDREILDTKALYNHRVDGLLACISKETQNMEHFVALQDKGVPVVFFDREVSIDASQVLVDDVKASYDATRHLIESGHRALLHFSGPERLALTQNRIQGFTQAMREANLPCGSDQIITCADGTPEEAERIVNDLLARKVAFDGIYAVNDIAAFGAMKALKAAGKSVPGEVGIVGFSNWQFSSFTDPGLTTVDQPGYLMGQKAAELILQEIKMKDNEFIEPQRITLPAALVVRGTS